MVCYAHTPFSPPLPERFSFSAFSPEGDMSTPATGFLDRDVLHVIVDGS